MPSKPRPTGRLACIALMACWHGGAVFAQQTATPALPRSRFLEARAVATEPAQAALAVRWSAPGRAAVSLTSAGLFEDGTQALITGYVQGSRFAVAVQRPSGEGFNPIAAFTEVETRPDLIQAADLNGDGHRDLLIAARNGAGYQILLGDGRGHLLPQPAVKLAGVLTGAAAWRSASGRHLVAATVCRAGCSLDLYRADGTRLAAIALAGRPNLLAADRVNSRNAQDLIVGDSSGISVVDGSSASTAHPQVVRLPIANAVALATGSFVYDLRGYRQIAVLTGDGALHFFARAGVLSTPPPPPSRAARSLARQHQLAKKVWIAPASLAWTEVETLPRAATVGNAETPLLLRARVSGSGMDDLLLLNAGARIVTVRHPVVLVPAVAYQDHAGMSVLPARLEAEAGPAGVLSAAALRLPQDGRLGLFTASGKAQPDQNSMTVDKTFTVNTQLDEVPTSAERAACSNGTAGCTLRAAFALVDEDATANETDGRYDTVDLEAGTYTLGNFGPADPYGDAEYHIEVYGPVRVVGAGAASTIVGAGNHDKVFSENSGYATAANGVQTPIDAYFSNLTLTDGTNANNYLNPSQQTANVNGGLMDGDTGGSGSLTFVDCNFLNGVDPYGPGGGLFVSDNLIANLASATPVYGDGMLEIDGGTFSGNVTVEDGAAVSTGVGGGEVPIDLEGVTFTSNSIDPALSTDTYGDGRAGAVYFGSLFQLECTSGTSDGPCGPVPAAESLISGSTFTQNTAVSNPNNMPGGIPLGGGGAIYAEDGLDIAGNTFSGNATDNEGGAIWLGALDVTPTVGGNKFTANTALDAGAIFILNCTANDDCGVDPVSATVHYNYIVGNTSSGTGRNGLGIGSETSADANAPVDAAYNFWGCNTGANTTGCQNAALNGGTGTLTLTPWAIVGASLNTLVPAMGSPVTISGGITTDSTGAAMGSANLGAFAGISASLGITQNGASLTGGSVSATTGSDAEAEATGTATHGGGSATITIAGATATLNFSTPPALGLAVSLSQSTIGPGTSIAYTTTLTNSSLQGQSSVSFVSNLPGGLTFDPGKAENTCGGSTAASTGTSLALSGATLAADASCHVAIAIVPADAGSYVFTSGPVMSSPGGSGSMNSVTLTVSQVAPVVTLSAPAKANRGTAATLSATFTTGNPHVSPTAEMGFYADSTLLGSVPLTSAGAAAYTAQLATRDLPGGAHNLTARYPGDTNFTAAASIDHPANIVANNLWIANANGTVSAFSATGVPNLVSAESAGGIGVAIDQNGNVWSLGHAASSVAEFTSTGTVIDSGYTGGGISLPTALAIDAAGTVWVTNGTNSLSFLDSAGAPGVSSAYTSSTFQSPGGIAVDTSGNIWVANSNGNSVTEVLGAGFPTLSPLSSAVAGDSPAGAP